MAAAVRCLVAGAAAVLLLLGCALRAQQDVAVPPVRRPNVLLVLADDLRRDALGCHGNTYAHTSMAVSPALLRPEPRG